MNERVGEQKKLQTRKRDAEDVMVREGEKLRFELCSYYNLTM